MRHCPKCDLQFGDSAKICRSCGSILEEGPDGSTATASSVAGVETLPLERPPIHTEDWTCPQCGEQIPATFDVCWKCAGEPGEEQEETVAAVQTNGDTRQKTTAPRCLACGSERVIPSAHMADQGQASSGTLNVVVYGNPDALVFKDRLWGPCTAVVCGDCGHVEVRAENYGQLYDHYLRSLND